MEDRVSEINTKEFYRIISNVVKSYLYANNEEIVKIEDIYIVGSYLTDDFEEGVSDLDIFISTESEVSKPTRDYFWQYFNDCEQQSNMQLCVGYNIKRIDCVGIGIWDNRENTRKPYQKIT